MITFTMRVAGVERTLAKFQRLEAHLADFRGLWPEMIRIYQDVTNRAFDTQGASTGLGAWKPLAPSTVAERKRQGFGATPILKRTGTLRRAVTLPRVADQGATRLQLNVDSDIYPYHQTGTSKMPRRAPVAFTAGDRARFREALVLYVNRQIAQDIANTPDDFA